jgi:uncharacterized protein YecT (DUF1311 family)
MPHAQHSISSHENHPTETMAFSAMKEFAHPRLFLPLLFLLFLLTGTGAFAADDHPLDLALDTCMNADPSTQGVITCAGQAEEAWAAEEERLRQALLSRLDKKKRPAFEKSEQTWRAFREEERLLGNTVYGAILNEAGGSMWQVAHVLLDVGIPRERAMELGGMLAQLDLSWTLPPTDVAEAQKRHATADEALNEIYQTLYKRLKTEEQDVLRTTQRSWIVYRDAHLAFLKSFYDAEKNEGLQLHLAAGLTEARTRQLQVYLEDFQNAGMSEQRNQ